jgi:hypothetical protein
VHELFDPQLVNDPDVGPHIPSFSFILEDLTQLSDEALARRALDLITALALWAFRDGRLEITSFMQSVSNRAQQLDQLRSQGDSGEEAFQVIFRYILKVNRHRAPADFLHAIAAELTPPTRTALMTIAEQLEARGREQGRLQGKAEGEAKGRAEGRAEGEAKGRAEGKAEGERLLLQRLLVLKFGALSDADQQLLAGASEKQLLTWSERVLTAASLSEVFGS